ncbi:MAG: hypothetical protein WCZ23_04375 [Rhodospirillaceae bacterium]
MSRTESLSSPPLRTLYEDLLKRLEETLLPLPDKPDETPTTTLDSLWATAAGQPLAASQANARFIGRPDVTFACGDLAEPFESEEFLGVVDVVTCNLPYVSSAKVDTMHQDIRDHEPRLALDGGPFGIHIIQRLIQDAPRLLKPGGWLLFEVGLGQGEGIRQRLARCPAFDVIGSNPDTYGDIRVLAARRRCET